jgi:phosphoserine phosphatase
VNQSELESWNEGPAKQAILEFVDRVTREGPGYVEPEDRIAVFDNDGTLWCEKPMFVQAEFLIRRAKLMAGERTAPGGAARLREALGHAARLPKAIADSHAGMSTEAFEEAVGEFLDEATHPTLGVPYTATGYLPMLELIELLESHEFTIYICSGGGRDFVRVVSDRMYGIPRERVIGSGTMLEYRDGSLYRTKLVELPIDDHGGKPVHIWARTGRKPLFAAGNSDGDSAMLEIAGFGLLIRHDDDEREFAYTALANKAIADAPALGWTTVSMKDDWKTVFAQHAPG